MKLLKVKFIFDVTLAKIFYMTNKLLDSLEDWRTEGLVIFSNRIIVLINIYT